ncbi:MAG: Hsp20/alpha crystallin family protein [Anaerolineaceae bacterium]|nr:Hsp20/alpha crystallin family protein [Anaerolineaceae bacterium]
MANLIRRDPFDEMVSWNRAMNRMFDRFYGEDEPRFGDRFNLHMPLDVIENDNEFVVKADIAGINPEEVEITYTNNTLTLKGEVKDEREEGKEDSRYHLRERRYGSFVRSISMPGTIDVENIKADSENGVLVLHLPKKEEVKPKRIEVKVNAKDKVIEGKSKTK